MYFKNMLKLSALSLKLFVAHCITGGVDVRQGKMAGIHDFWFLCTSCHHFQNVGICRHLMESSQFTGTDRDIAGFSQRQQALSGLAMQARLSALWPCKELSLRNALFFYALFQLSMHTLLLEHVHAFSCIYICMLSVKIEHVHTYS